MSEYNHDAKDDLRSIANQIKRQVPKCYRDLIEKKEPIFSKEIRDVSNIFSISNSFVAKTEFYEFREVTEFKTNELRLAKIYRKKEFNDAQIDCIKREIKHFTELDHPCILKCRQVYEDELKVYILCEHLKGGSLFD